MDLAELLEFLEKLLEIQLSDSKCASSSVSDFNYCLIFIIPIYINILLLLAIAACFKKISVEEGWTWFPSTEEVERKHVYGTLKTSKYDWTLIKDTPEKGWTTQRSS